MLCSLLIFLVLGEVSTEAVGDVTLGEFFLHVLSECDVEVFSFSLSVSYSVLIFLVLGEVSTEAVGDVTLGEFFPHVSSGCDVEVFSLVSVLPVIEIVVVVEGGGWQIVCVEFGCGGDSIFR